MSSRRKHANRQTLASASRPSGRREMPALPGVTKVSRKGFTLGELLVAIALMLIIVLQLQIIFSGSRRLFESADALVQVFQNARIALDMVERDLANAVKTDQMEFFNDRVDQTYGYGFFNADLNEQADDLQGGYFDGEPYVYALAAKQPKPYTPPETKQGGPYRKDSLYFRSYSSVGGQPKDLLIEYFLWTGDFDENPRRRPVLRRMVTELEGVDGATGKAIIKKHDPVDVCYYVQEFKIELFVPDRAGGGLGRFYSPKEAVVGGEPPAGDPRPPEIERLGSGDLYGLMCAERGRGLFDKDTGILTVNAPLRRLGAGDRLYVLTEPITSSGTGGARTDFNSYLRIRAVDRTQPTVPKVEFVEQAVVLDKIGSHGAATVQVDWRGGWLPSALRVTLRIMDARSREVRTIQRIVELPKA